MASSGRPVRTALVVVRDPEEARSMSRLLGKRGFHVIVDPDPDRSLRSCRDKAPDVVVVERSLPGITASRFLAELVRISWTTGAILIADLDEETVHAETEGLGILGSIRSCEDLETLDSLLTKLADIAPG